MRVFILGLDALEYDLVVKWRLKYLMQEQYGKIQTIINKSLQEPFSPEVWGSFITGELQHINNWFVYSNRVVEFLRRRPPFNWIKGKRKFFGVAPKRYTRKEDLTGSTLFDIVPRSIALDVPTYSFNALKLREIKKKRLEEGLESYKEFSYKHYRKQIEEMFRRINEDWQLFMIWFPIADDIGHAFIGNEKVMKNLYRKLNLLAYNVNQAVGDDTLLLIVSDHGMQLTPEGIDKHTNHAFYSLSQRLDWSIQHILDLHPLILETVKK